MRILALNPFHGGSHKAFLEGWQRHSRHDFTVLSLPARHWKWRMRHAAVTLAGRVADETHEATWDLLFTTDMLNLAEFRGLVAKPVRDLPAVVYFHENQLTYPSRLEPDQAERDLHFAFTNFTTALAADSVWFNSDYHRGDFLSSLSGWLGRMPDCQPIELVNQIHARSHVQQPGIEPFPPRGPRRDGPLRLVWVARWEYDKDPETFFAALDRLQSAGVDFQVSALGEAFADVPDCFGAARQRLGDRVIQWGYLPSRAAYREALQQSDVFISTARHEFFGIAAAEAIAAGCFPLLPNRLAYPELVRGRTEFLYDAAAEALADRITDLVQKLHAGTSLTDLAASCRSSVEQWRWSNRAREMDAAAEAVVQSGNPPN